jgi:hypothetical protein
VDGQSGREHLEAARLKEKRLKADVEEWILKSKRRVGGQAQGDGYIT